MTLDPERLSLNSLPAKTAIFTVEKPGMLSLVQDAGRAAYLGMGIPKGGPMDTVSARQANELVGNPEGHALLELTLMGPQLRVEGSAQIALTGADLSARLNGEVLSKYENHLVQSGDILSFGRPQMGCRAYLAIRGTWSQPSKFGSKSAFPPALSSFLPESRLQKGSSFRVQTPDFCPPHKLPIADHLKVPDTWQIGLYPGPEFEQFSRLEIGQFFSQTFTVNPASNRMGIRLGPALEAFSPQPEMLSSGVMAGTIQMAHGGQVIVLMADAQTTGGYPRFGQVASDDLSKLGQARPGDSVRFRLMRY